MKETVSSKNAPAAIGPYSQAVKYNGILYTSGIIPADPLTGEIPDGIGNQAHLAFSNLKALIEDAGSSMADVLKTTLFIDNMDDFAVINGIYSEYFKKPYPARSCVEVSKLPKGVLLEAEAVAAID